MKRFAVALAVLAMAGGCAQRDAGQTVPPVTGGAWAPGAETKVRADFLKLIDRPKVAANVKVLAPTTANGMEQTGFSFDAEKGQNVPGILLKANRGIGGATGRLPVVIYLHGTGGKKEDGLAVMRDVVRWDMIGVAIDGRYHGARAAAFPKEGAMNAYETAIYRAWKENDPVVVRDQKGDLPAHPLYYDTVWDIMRLIDYLETRPDVDPKRIGLYGVSKGGIEAYLAAAVDVRIAACVPCISVESFQWALEHDQWKPRVETFQKAFDAAAKDSGIAAPDKTFVKAFYDRVMPGIDGEFDGPSVVPLIAPRALMTINGDKDPRTPPASLRLATDAARAAYKAARAEDHLVVRVQLDTPHQVRTEAQMDGVEFLANWLKK